MEGSGNEDKQQCSGPLTYWSPVNVLLDVPFSFFHSLPLPSPPDIGPGALYRAPFLAHFSFVILREALVKLPRLAGTHHPPAVPPQ